MILRELFIKLGLDADAASFAEGMTAVEGLKMGLNAIVDAAKAVVLGLVETVKNVAETGEHIHNLAQSTGIGAESLQRLGYVASLAGVSLDELSVGLFHLAKTGVKDVEAEVGRIAEQFHNMKDGGEKTRIAMEKFGRSGARLIPILNRGKGALKEIMQEADDLGIVLDEETLKATVEFEHQTKALNGALQGLKNDAVKPLLKPITEFLIRLRGWVKVWREFRVNTAAVVQVLKVVAGVMGGVLLTALLAQAGAAAGVAGWYFALGVQAVMAAGEAAIAWLSVVGPLALAALGIFFVYAAFDDLMTFFKGGDSVIQRMIDGWKNQFTGFGDFIKTFGNWLGSVFIDWVIRPMLGPILGPYVAKMLQAKRQQMEAQYYDKTTGANQMPGFFGGAAATPYADQKNASGWQFQGNQSGGNTPFNANFVINVGPGVDPKEIMSPLHDTVKQGFMDYLAEVQAGTHG